MLSVKVNSSKLEMLKNKFKDSIIEQDLENIVLIIKDDSHIITAYKTKHKNVYKVTFQGKDSLDLALSYSDDPLFLPKKKKNEIDNPIFYDVCSQIGVASAGSFDFLGPVVVCSTYIDETIIKLLEQYNLLANNLSDNEILEIVPLLLKKIYFDYKVLSCEKINKFISKGLPFDNIKAILFNHCITSLELKFPYIHNVYINEFDDKNHYLNFLNNIQPIEKSIIIRKPNDDYFPSLILAKHIARYFLIKEIASIEKMYNISLPNGNGRKVNIFSKTFIKKFGRDEFNKICKIHFVNYNEVLNGITN